MIAINKFLFERTLTQAEMQQMMLNSPQAAQAVQGIQVAPGVVVPAVAPAPVQPVAVAPAQQAMRVAPATQQVVATAPVAAAPVQPVAVAPAQQVAATARRLGVSQPYQAGMNKSFNQFRQETGRLPQVAGDKQVGPVNPTDQARINQLHKQYMTAGVPAKTVPGVAATKAVEQPAVAKTATEAPAAEAATKAAKEAAQTSKEISGTEAAGIALKKGAQATGEAVGSGAKKAMEFAGENPVAGGLVAGAVGALGLRKLLHRNKSV
jgi:hypothetical protein